MTGRTPPGNDQNLAAEIEAAVGRGLELLQKLTDTTSAAYERGRLEAAQTVQRHGDRPGREQLESVNIALAELHQDVRSRLERQSGRLATFNLVLFGRTGVGKSSLIEALSSGTGEPISLGESDWTTDVREVPWGACRLFDTPGIAGWGRTMSREELEERAEAAVADADVVVLCFDTQSQQEGEFGKVAEWVSRYGKPVVAVLNSRNGRWRFPTRVPLASARRQLSRSVHEHATNIRDELARIGLPDVPVVAIHGKRAAFARTADPYLGPDAASRQKLRAEVGPDHLLAWSNLPALERLLSEALRLHASELRLGMLHEQTRGLLRDSIERLGREHSRPATMAAEEYERGIDDVLRLLGRPTKRVLGRALSELEKLRGGGFVGSANGEVDQHARARTAARLRQPRTRAFRRAERLVDRAFEKRRDLEDREFAEVVLEPAAREVKDVAEAVKTEISQYLEQRLTLIASDVELDLEAAQSEFRGAKGSAGRARRWAGVGLGSGSALTSIGTGVFMVLAVANSWNPLGWATLGGIAVAQISARIFSRFLSKKAAAAREQARASARGNARRAVADSFGSWEREIARAFTKSFANAVNDQLTNVVDVTIALRRSAVVAARASAELAAALESVPSSGVTTTILSELAVDLQRRIYPGEPTADRLLWLGESWCADPEGLTDEENLAEPARTSAYDPARSRRLIDRMRKFATRAGRRPQPGAGRKWLERTRDHLSEDTDAIRALEPVERLLREGRPRLVVAGDYSAGKSSFIKRLLIDAGEPVPDGLDVAGSPETRSASGYRWGDWELIDTPGFQSSEPAYAAHEAIVGASVLLILFNPNLVVGDVADLGVALSGDPTSGRIGKLQRALLVINRADELGVDPDDDPDAYDQLCARKELELRQAILAMTQPSPVEVAEGQVICAASDPYGMVGDRTDVTSSDYDAHRGWDGMDGFHRALARHADAFRNGIDVGVLESGSAILGQLAAERYAELEAIQARLAQQQRLLLDLDACLTSGLAIRDGAREKLIGLLVGMASEMYDDIVLSLDAHTRQARIDRLAEWSNDPEIWQRYSEWATEVEAEMRAWRESTAERVERRLNASSFRAAFPGINEQLDLDHLQPDGSRTTGTIGRGVGSKAADMASQMSRDTVAAGAKRFGVKFRPWGATKLTSKVNVAGGALGIAFGVWEGYNIIKGLRREKTDEEQEHKARGNVLAGIRAAVANAFDGVDGDASPAAAIDADVMAVTEVRDRQAESLRRRVQEEAELKRKIAACEASMREALEAL